MLVFRSLGLHRSVLWHATAEHEAEDIRHVWGKDADVILRVNDTLLPPSAVTPSVNDKPALRAVFLSRIVEHKGLSIVLSALRHSSRPISLDIFGASEDATYLEECQRLSRELPYGVTVRFRGEVQPEAVRATLADFELLVLPTAGENFGHVIAEALSASCPVMTTPYTPWTDALRLGGGVLVPDRTSDAWSQAIESYAELTPEERLKRRYEAGECYELWSSRTKNPHLWEIAEEEFRCRQS
ncbi:glycosyltransferase family 4 protein [Tessaracoccus sp. OS52]|uniref:glycosyltransferase family 4 protein n=1 Tax=Tessaracoccus sp. OS52 TaxID=2886691 RepID=UPI001D123608|nr:glycosyltransferase family 4 protein [Tessaracoccus sp. OS52]